MYPRLPLMSTWRSIRAVGLSGLIVCGMVIGAAQPAAAQLVQLSHRHEVFTYTDEFCGLSLTITIDVLANEQERIAKSGFPLFMSGGRYTVTFTNPDTGKSVVKQSAGTTKDLTVTDNGDGTITLRTAITGLAEAIMLPGGTVATRDVGRVVFVTVLDYNGTPLDTSDDEFVSQEVESISGPHPDLESGFELFCATLVPALT